MMLLCTYGTFTSRYSQHLLFLFYDACKINALIKNLERIFEKTQQELLSLKNSRGKNVFSGLDGHYGFKNIDEFIQFIYKNYKVKKIF
jgi:hypothetical protein